MAWTKLGSTKVASELGTAANGTNTGVTLLGNASEIVMGNSGATNLTTTYLTYKKITGLTVGATIDRVLFYVYSCSNTSFKGAVYDHDASNDRPDTMLGSQGEITGVSVSNTNTEKEITLGSSATVGSSGIVWVAIIPNNDTYVATGVAESGGASTSYSVYDASSNGLYSDYANNLRSTAIYQGAGSNNIKYGVKNSSGATVYSHAKLGTGAYSLDGNDYVEVTGLKTIFNGATKLSVAGWIYPRDNVDETLLGQWNGSGNSDKILDLHINGSNKLELSLRDGSTNYITTSSTSINENAWQHVAMTYDGATTTVKLNINGTLDETDTSNPSSLQTGTGSPAVFGIYGDKSSNGFDGILDDWGCWSRVITATEISALYNSGTGALVSSLADTDGLVAHYEMNTNDSNVAVNSATIPDGEVAVGDTITVDSLTAKKNLMIQMTVIPSGDCDNIIRFNNDSGQSYARRRSQEGGAESEAVSQTGINWERDYDEFAFSTMNVNNISDEEKLVLMENVTNNGNGAGNVPKRIEMVWKWDNTSNAITRVDLINTQSGSFGEGTEVTVYGTD